MRIDAVASPVTNTTADAVVIGWHSAGQQSAAATAVDRAAAGLIGRLVEQKELSGKPYDVTPLYGLPGVQAPLVLVVGLGDRDNVDRKTAFRAAAAAARHLGGKQRGDVAFFLDDGWPADQTESGVCGALAGCVGQDLYRAEKKRLPFERLLWSGGEAAGVDRGRILGEAVNLTRRLVNEPPQNIYPESFAERAKAEAAACGLSIEVWDQDRLEGERCGSLLAVARGSSRPPRLVIVRHNGGPAGQAPLALVGKGVTFDSGGLSLKPSESMVTMKCDMAGAATVLGAMTAIARLRLPMNVIGLMGLVENMPGPAAMKLGDVLTARNGRTIEVLNTDAEGRLVLADVLDVAVERGAGKLVDLATLTGACVVALGRDVAGALSNNEAWSEQVLAATRLCGEDAWPLPMFADYDEHIKSDVADIKNIGDGRWGGAITAAKFLEQFVAGKPWVHLDIAGPAFLEKPKPWCDGGASGAFVRTLVELARGWS